MTRLSSLRITQEKEELEEQIASMDITPQESARQWLELQKAFGEQLRQTEDLFAQDRREALIELQRRLKQLEEWQSCNG